jgi:hypothetical protein
MKPLIFGGQRIPWRLLGIATLVLSIGASAAVIFERSAAEPSDSNGHDEIEYVDARWASASARDLHTLLTSSDAVFVGRVTQSLPQRLEPPPVTPEPSRTSGDETAQVGPQGFPVSRFNVEAITPLHGSLVSGQVIVVEQLGGEIVKVDGTQHVLLDGDSPIAVGNVYLFFVRAKENGTYSSPPFARFPVQSGRVAAPVGWEDVGVAGLLNGRSVSDALQEVKDAN